MKFNIHLELDKSQVEATALLAKFSEAIKTGEDPLALLTDRLYIRGINYSSNNADLQTVDINIKNGIEK